VLKLSRRRFNCRYATVLLSKKEEEKYVPADRHGQVITEDECDVCAVQEKKTW
jgi:hypothetical protein